MFNYIKSSLQGFIQRHPIFWATSLIVLTGGLAAFWYGLKFLYSTFTRRPAIERNPGTENSSSTPTIISSLQQPNLPSLHSIDLTNEVEAIASARTLLAQGCSLAERDTQGQWRDFANTPLLAAIATGKFDLAKLYIDHIIAINQPAIFNLQDQRMNAKNSPLILAIMQNQEGIALDIIRGGADINLVTANGSTALHYACMLRLKPVILELLKRGAQPHKPNNLVVTPLEYYLYDFSFNPKAIPIFYRKNERIQGMAPGVTIVRCNDSGFLKDLDQVMWHQGHTSLFDGSRPEKDLSLISRLSIGITEQPIAFSRRANELYRFNIMRCLDDIIQMPTFFRGFPQKIGDLFNSKIAKQLSLLAESNPKFSEEELNTQAILLAKKETCDELMEPSINCNTQ